MMWESPRSSGRRGTRQPEDAGVAEPGQAAATAPDTVPGAAA